MFNDLYRELVNNIYLLAISFLVIRCLFKLYFYLKFKSLIILTLSFFKEIIVMLFCAWLFFKYNRTPEKNIFLLYSQGALIIGYGGFLLFSLKDFFDGSRWLSDQSERVVVLIERQFKKGRYANVKSIFKGCPIAYKMVDCLRCLYSVYLKEKDYEMAYSACMDAFDCSKNERDKYFFLRTAGDICLEFLSDVDSAIELYQKCFEYDLTDEEQRELVSLIEKNPKKSISDEVES